MIRVIFLFLLLATALSACSTVGKGVVEAKLEKSPDSEKGLLSASFALTKLDEESKGYGLYTYVITGSKLSAPESLSSDPAAVRLQSLLEAIDLSTVLDKNLRKANIPNSGINLFCIPVKAAHKLADLENYNFELALLYRDIAIGTLKNEAVFLKKFSTNLGPFLVSTLQPLNQVKTPQPVLFTDLSSTNPSAMKELVAAYKQKVNVGVTANNPQKFDPLKLRILSIILDADKNIKLMKDAVAAWKSSE